MNFEKVQRKNRKAISPVLATVILIAITLIAAIAIAGFVFGLFGSFTSTAQVSATTVNIPATLTGTAIAAPTCGAVASGTNLALQNTGTSAATVGTITISYTGHTYTVAAPAGCTVGAGASEGLTFTAIGAAAAPSGVEFTGSMSMSNGGVVSFTGIFQ